MFFFQQKTAFIRFYNWTKALDSFNIQPQETLAHGVKGFISMGYKLFFFFLEKQFLS